MRFWGGTQGGRSPTEIVPQSATKFMLPLVAAGDRSRPDRASAGRGWNGVFGGYKIDIPAQRSSRFADGFVGPEVDLLVFNGSPQCLVPAFDGLD